ncbi:hypothetical protein DAEQUDRAFT_753522 [Daedalea quercina L-15889]|uniref:F-box domain-containing protein n=1 Tax=Daedalea quercina L-15889 TaxID=1314783 RepID=A0A165UEE9_9APHY|nr:hypothetical protein DAEQUDRAFT_753522 [Daedalea quercina L-15889]
MKLINRDPELLREICAILVSDHKSWHTLPALARTGKAFFEPAVNTLWRIIPSLSILFFLFPADAWTVEMGQRYWHTHRVSLRRALVPADFARFHIYAHRIKVFGDAWASPLIGLRKYMLSREALEALYNYRPTPCLLPDLRQVHACQGVVPFLSVLLGSHVESVTMLVGCSVRIAEDPRTLRMLSSIPRKCPRLSQLQVSCGSESKKFMDATAGLCPALTKLVDFAMPYTPITAAVLDTLATSLRLKFLHIFVELDDGPQSCEALFAHSLAVPSFTKLKELTINVENIEHATRFLACVSSSRLCALHVNCRTPPSAQEAEALFDALRSHPSRQSLYSLRVDAFHDPSMDMSTRWLTNETLRPLLELRLQLLTLMGFLVDVDDSMLESMARAWPELHCLSMAEGERWGTAHPPRATILGIIPFIEHCPDIEVIGYRMQTDVFRSGDVCRTHGRPGRGVTTHRAIELNVGDSRIHDSIEVASFLSDVAPELCHISNMWRTRDDLDYDEEMGPDMIAEEDMHYKWQEVRQYSEHFALPLARSSPDCWELISRTYRHTLLIRNPISYTAIIADETTSPTFYFSVKLTPSISSILSIPDVV